MHMYGLVEQSVVTGIDAAEDTRPHVVGMAILKREGTTVVGLAAGPTGVPTWSWGRVVSAVPRSVGVD